MSCGTCETKKEGKLIGKVSHYYSNLGVAIIELEDVLKVGDKIRIEGGETVFEQEVESMQVEYKDTAEAKKGDAVGVKVQEKVREGNRVYKL